MFPSEVFPSPQWMVAEKSESWAKGLGLAKEEMMWLPRRTPMSGGAPVALTDQPVARVPLETTAPPVMPAALTSTDPTPKPEWSPRVAKIEKIWRPACLKVCEPKTAQVPGEICETDAAVVAPVSIQVTLAVGVGALVLVSKMVP